MEPTNLSLLHDRFHVLSANMAKQREHGILFRLVMFAVSGVGLALMVLGGGC